MPLAEYFACVFATDASADQLRQAPTHPRITWAVAPAEASGLPTDAVDVVTVAQALHWFDLSRFWREVERVLRPGGVFVAWTYGIPAVGDPAITRSLRHFHDDVVGDFWPVERGHVEAAYRAIPVPLPRLEPPQLVLRASWPLERLLGYLRTWSAVQRYVAANGVDPVTELGKALAGDWDAPREVTWPMTILAGRKPVLPHGAR